MWFLENENLKVAVTSAGAELVEIIFKPTGINYLWSGDSSIWGRRAPVLFPIVGKLKNNEYTYQGRKYSLPQHGFARDKEFKLIEYNTTSVTLSLSSDASTLEVYPFQFELQISYHLNHSTLITVYKVINKDADLMYYSIGAHPGFTCPLYNKETYEDYRLVFNQKERLSRVLLEGGLRSAISEEVILEEDQQTLPLHKNLFEVKDAIVVQQLNSDKIRLEAKDHGHGIEFSFKNFPWFGIWSKPGPFICLEPWMGVADSIHSSGKLEEKEAILKLEPNTSAEFQFEVSIF